MYKPRNQDFLVRPHGIVNPNDPSSEYDVLRFFNGWGYENTQTAKQLKEYLEGAGLEFIEGWGPFSKPCGYYRIKGEK